MMTDEIKDYENSVIKMCFNDPDALAHCIGRSAGNNIFNQASTRAIWEAFKICYNTEVNISISSVSDVFRSTMEDLQSADEMIEIFKDLVGTSYEEETEWKYHFFYIHELWKKRRMMDVKRYIEDNINNRTSSELSGDIIDKLTDISSGEIEIKTFRQSIKSTMENLKEVKSGQKSNVIVTTIKELDSTGILQVRKEILLVSPKKCGKSRFATFLVDKICSHNPDIAIQWYSLEMRVEEVIRMFISLKARVTDLEMTSSEELTEAQYEAIEMANKYIKEYPIELIDTPVTIYNIVSQFATFCKKNDDKRKILIIDNIGMIKRHIDSDILFEDDIARHLKNLRDTQDATILAIHHMNKESESRLNKENGYEPRPNHMRGSSRLMDFANSMVILHRPDMYHDLVEEAAQQHREDEILGLFVVNVALNRGGPTKKMLLKHEIGFCNFEQYGE